MNNLFSAITLGENYRKVAKTTTNFEGVLLHAIREVPYDTDFLNTILEKTTNFDGCLQEYLMVPPREKYREIFSKNKYTNSFIRCMIGKHRKLNKDFLSNLLYKSDDVDGCLYYALLDPNLDFTFLNDLIEKTVDGEDAILLAIEFSEILEEMLVNKIIKKTFDFTDALQVAVRTVPHSYDLILNLADRVTDVEGCLLELIKEEVDDQDIMFTLFYKTVDYSECLLRAIEFTPWNDELIDALFKVTTDFAGCLEVTLEVIPEDEELLARLKNEK